MAKSKGTQTTIYKTLHRKLKIEQNFTCMRGDTEKIKKHFSIEPILANPRIVVCSVVYRRCITQTLM